MRLSDMRLIRRNENGEAVGFGAPLLVVGLLLALALLGAGGAAVVSSVRSPSPPSPSAKVFPPLNYVSLPEMSIPVGGGTGREMDVKLLLEFDPLVKKDVAFGYETRISERLGDKIREIGLDQLQGAEGAKLLKGAVAAVVDRELRPVRVRDVLIEKMIVR
jgi:flagellar protein FliL